MWEYAAFLPIISPTLTIATYPLARTTRTTAAAWISGAGGGVDDPQEEQRVRAVTTAVQACAASASSGRAPLRGTAGAGVRDDARLVCVAGVAG